MIKRSIDTCERILARVWPFLLGAVVCGALVSCAMSHVATTPDGEEILVTTGEHIAPGIADTIGGVVGAPIEDIVGAANDAVSSADVPEIVEDAASGNWISAVLGIAGVGLAVFAGVRRRKKIREAAGK